MDDVVEELKLMTTVSHGYANHDFTTIVKHGLIARAVSEIERLRAQVADLTRLAGCVAVGKEFAEIKKSATTESAGPSHTIFVTDLAARGRDHFTFEMDAIRETAQANETKTQLPIDPADGKRI